MTRREAEIHAENPSAMRKKSLRHAHLESTIEDFLVSFSWPRRTIFLTDIEPPNVKDDIIYTQLHPDYFIVKVFSIIWTQKSLIKLWNKI